MSGGHDTSQQSSRLPNRPAYAAIARLVIAGTLTVVTLPYLWARSFVGWQMMGRPETVFALLLLIVLTVIIGLNFRVGPTRPRWIAPVCLIVGCAWMVVNFVLFY